MLILMKDARKNNRFYFLITLILSLGNFGRLIFFPVSILVNAINPKKAMATPNKIIPAAAPRTKMTGNNTANATRHFNAIIGYPPNCNLLVLTKINKPIKRYAYAASFCHKGIVTMTSSSTIF